MSDIKVNARDAALKAQKKGWFLIPIAEGDKTPDLALMPHWGEQSTDNAAIITSWFEQNANRPYAIDLGKSNLTVLDFDSTDVPPNVGLPETLVVKTGRGQHFYYAGRVAQGNMYFGGKHLGEIKSEGGYVLGPFSPHPTGAVYSPVNRAEIVDAPSEIVAGLRQSGQSKERVSVVGGKIPYGQHYNFLLSLAGMLREAGLNEAEIEPVLTRTCEERCEGYLADYRETTAHLAREMAKKPAGPAGPTTSIGGVFPGQPLQQAGPIDVENWRDYFRSFDELEEGDVKMIINDFLPEGINFIGDYRRWRPLGNTCGIGRRHEPS